MNYNKIDLMYMVFNLGMRQRPETATLSSTFLWHYSIGFT